MLLFIIINVVVFSEAKFGFCLVLRPVFNFGHRSLVSMVTV